MRDYLHITFIVVHCYNYCILLCLNLFLYLIYKLNFMIGIMDSKRENIELGSIHSVRHPHVVLEHIARDWQGTIVWRGENLFWTQLWGPHITTQQQGMATKSKRKLWVADIDLGITNHSFKQLLLSISFVLHPMINLWIRKAWFLPLCTMHTDVHWNSKSTIDHQEGDGLKCAKSSDDIWHVGSSA